MLRSYWDGSFWNHFGISHPLGKAARRHRHPRPSRQSREEAQPHTTTCNVTLKCENCHLFCTFTFLARSDISTALALQACTKTTLSERFTVLYCVLYCRHTMRQPSYSTQTTQNLQYCIVLYCTALYCTVKYCTVLHCTVLVVYCTVLVQR